MPTFICIVIEGKVSTAGQALRPFLQVDLTQLLPITGIEFIGLLSFAYFYILLFIYLFISANEQYLHWIKFCLHMFIF